VFTNANIKIDDVRVEPHDTFMTGAIWRGYEMFPDKDFYYFLNEYVVLRKDIKFAKANDVSSIAHFPGGFDGEDQSNWLKGNYKDQEFMNMVNSKNWDGVYSSMFACKKHVLHRLVDIGFNTIIPNNIVESQSMERGWGIMFKKLGMDHTASSVCGNFFACLKQPKTRNMLFNITGNGG